MAQAAIDYPVQFSVDYPDRPLNRFTTLFRPIFLLPVAVILSALSGGNIFLATILMILFRRKYPRWWFDWIVELARFENRVVAYLLLLSVGRSTGSERQLNPPKRQWSRLLGVTRV